MARARALRNAPVDLAAGGDRLSEIVVGTVAQLIIGATVGATMPHTDESWIKCVAGTGAIVLTFLAGAELDPAVFRTQWKEASAVGVVGFVAPFLGCTAVAYFGLHWTLRSSWLAGVAMSTTSVAVVYAVMLEFGSTARTTGRRSSPLASSMTWEPYWPLASSSVPLRGKPPYFSGGQHRGIHHSCPTSRLASSNASAIDPRSSRQNFSCSVLFGLGALATWSGEARRSYPAYLVGMVLAGTVGKDHALIRRLRTLTFGLLTPFYFIRAGSSCRLPALVAAPTGVHPALGRQDAEQVLGSLSDAQKPSTHRPVRRSTRRCSCRRV